MSATLTVWDIATHLGVQDWQVSRQCGRDKGIPAVKAKGPGSVGRGGQWRIRRDDYLAWLRLPFADIPDVRDPLPPVRLLLDIADEYQVDAKKLRDRWRREVSIGRPWSRGNVIIPPSGLAPTLNIAYELKKWGHTA